MEIFGKNIIVLICISMLLYTRCTANIGYGQNAIPCLKILPCDPICQNGGTPINETSCRCPGGVIGTQCNQVAYWSFDTLDNLTPMQQDNISSYDALVVGQINSAVSSSKNEDRWINLGIHTEICMAQPDTCGENGGAVSLWHRVVSCPSLGGIVSSVSTATPATSSGFSVYCGSQTLGYLVSLLDGYFILTETINFHWLHSVLNYIGPNEHQGINIYHNGGHVGNGTKTFKQAARVNGRISIGRLAYEQNRYYASVQVDELLFYNRALTEDEITMLSQSG